MGNVKTKAQVDTLADTLAQSEAEILSDTPSDVKTKALVDKLAETLTEVEAKILATHWLMCKAIL